MNSGFSPPSSFETQIVEQQFAPAVAALAPQEARRNDLVGVDVRRAHRQRDRIEAAERLHITSSP